MFRISNEFLLTTVDHNTWNMEICPVSKSICFYVLCSKESATCTWTIFLL